MFNSIKHTWELFSLDEKNPTGDHIVMIATPFILSFGATLVLLKFIPLIASVILGIALFITVSYVMGWNDRYENEMIARRKANTDTSHLYPGEMPRQYVGPKRWIALGRVHPDDFLEAVISRDPDFSKLSRDELRNSIEYAYMADTFSARNSSPALKYVSPTTKGAYPVTHLKPPYDYYVDKKSMEELTDES